MAVSALEKIPGGETPPNESNNEESNGNTGKSEQNRNGHASHPSPLPPRLPKGPTGAFSIVNLPSVQSNGSGKSNQSNNPKTNRDYNIVPVSNHSNMSSSGRNELMVPILGSEGLPATAIVSAANPLLVTNNGKLAVVLMNDPEKFGKQSNMENGMSNTSSNSPYDLHDLNANSAASSTHASSILAPIEENDSPYSTSSTTRSCKSSNYPSTASIFGHKYSPPPTDELPPLPTVTVTPGSSHSSMKSEVGASYNANGGRINKGMTWDEEESSRPSPHERFRYPSDLSEVEEEDSRPYMTIEELKESKTQLEQQLENASHSSGNNNHSNQLVEMHTQTGHSLDMTGKDPLQPDHHHHHHHHLHMSRQNAISKDDFNTNSKGVGSHFSSEPDDGYGEMTMSNDDDDHPSLQSGLTHSNSESSFSSVHTKLVHGGSRDSNNQSKPNEDITGVMVHGGGNWAKDSPHHMNTGRSNINNNNNHNNNSSHQGGFGGHSNPQPGSDHTTGSGNHNARNGKNINTSSSGNSNENSIDIVDSKGGGKNSKDVKNTGTNNKKGGKDTDCEVFV